MKRFMINPPNARPLNDADGFTPRLIRQQTVNVPAHGYQGLNVPIPRRI